MGGEISIMWVALVLIVSHNALINSPDRYNVSDLIGYQLRGMAK